MSAGIPLEHFFSISGEPFLVINEKSQVIAANNAIVRLLGYSQKELEGKNFTDLVHDDDKPAVNNHLSTSQQSTLNAFHSRILAKDGTNKWINWKVFRPAARDTIFLVGQDTTDAKLAETALRAESRKLAEAKARNEAILNSVGEGVVAFSDRGEVVFVNAQALTALAVTQDDFIGKHIIQVMTALDEKGKELSAEKNPIHQALLKGKRIASQDVCFRNSRGRLFPAAVTASAVFLHGALIGGVVVFRDITKEKDVDRMKTDFISLASHQLRTPLSAMKWLGEILLSGDSGPLNEEQRKMIQNIYSSNERMIGLVNALLNISRIESGRIIIDPKPVELKRLVEEVLEELDQKIKEKGHNVSIHVEDGLNAINADPKLVRHIYMNLLTNSIKYTPPGGEIKIALSKKGAEVVSQISDNGFGIPKAQHEKIFEKFFRAQNVAKKETDGTGLGLYLVKQVVDSSGGKVWFESDENRGTTFWFTLPISGVKPKTGEVAIDA